MTRNVGMIGQADFAKSIERETALTLGTAITPFGCCNFFDSCTDEVLSLTYRGTLKLLDWMGFNISEDCYRSVEFIACDIPEQSQGVPTVGYISDPCADPNGVDISTCKLTVEDFGRNGRKGPVRDLFKPERWCKTRPRLRLDGSPVTSELEWDMLFAMDVMLDDIRKLLITGNATTAGQFDGLERWVRTGAFCGMLDSYVVDWNGNAMSGGNGITINGVAIANTFNLVDVILDIFRNIRTRISWSPLLRNQTQRVGDYILILPSFVGRCLLDSYTCWSVCDGTQYNETALNTLEGREFRRNLNGGLFGDGRIFLDGIEIPLMFYDWELIKGPNRGDIYLLTGAIGGMRIWEGEHLASSVVMRELAQAGNNTHGFFTRDGNRVLGKIVTDNLCREVRLWMRLRLFCLAPWAQARIQDVRCVQPLGPLSPDPDESSFYPQVSCPVDEC